jgi:hypothetical protein
MLSHNLNYLVAFHNDTQALLHEKRQIVATAKTPHVRHTLDQYRLITSANSLLLLLAYVEEMLLLLWRRTFPGHDLPKGTGVDRYKSLFPELGIQFEALTCWRILKDAICVRHCVLHANGRVSLMRNAEAVRACIARHSTELSVKQDRVVITPEFLRSAVDATWQLQETLLAALED